VQGGDGKNKEDQEDIYMKTLRNALKRYWNQVKDI